MARRAWLTSAAVVIVAAGLVIALLILKPWSIAPTATPTPTPSASAAVLAVNDETLVDLSQRLTSSDPATLAAAVGLDPGDVPAAVYKDFPTLQITFDSTGAEQNGNAWTVPATVTQADGAVTAWSVTIAETENGLVFVDSAPANGVVQ